MLEPALLLALPLPWSPGPVALVYPRAIQRHARETCFSCVSQHAIDGTKTQDMVANDGHLPRKRAGAVFGDGGPHAHDVSPLPPPMPISLASHQTGPGAVHRWRPDHARLCANATRWTPPPPSTQHHPIPFQRGNHPIPCQKVKVSAAALGAYDRRQGPGTDLRCSLRGIKRVGACWLDQGCAICLERLRARVRAPLDPNCSAV